MIERLCGEIFLTETDYIGIDVQGVGYQVYVVNPYAFSEGEAVTVYTHHVVREDAALLYGFTMVEERKLFRSLLAVSGVGPKAALAMLSASSPAKIANAIQTENTSFLVKLPGIGKKTAARLVLDLKDKLVFDMPVVKQAVEEPIVPDERQTVVEALTSLGYSEQEATKLAEKSYVAGQPVEDWIRAALRQRG